jgi:hypothetical protein
MLTPFVPRDSLVSAPLHHSSISIKGDSVTSFLVAPKGGNGLSAMDLIEDVRH